MKPVEEGVWAFIEPLQPDCVHFFILVFFPPVPISFTASPASPGGGEKDDRRQACHTVLLW